MYSHEWFDEVSCQAANDPLSGPLIQAGGYTVVFRERYRFIKHIRAGG